MRRYSLRPSRVLPCKYPVNDAILVGYTSLVGLGINQNGHVRKLSVQPTRHVSAYTEISQSGGCVGGGEGTRNVRKYALATTLLVQDRRKRGGDRCSRPGRDIQSGRKNEKCFLCFNGMEIIIF